MIFLCSPPWKLSSSPGYLFCRFDWPELMAPSTSMARTSSFYFRLFGPTLLPCCRCSWKTNGSILSTRWRMFSCPIRAVRWPWGFGRSAWEKMFSWCCRQWRQVFYSVYPEPISAPGYPSKYLPEYFWDCWADDRWGYWYSFAFYWISLWLWWWKLVVDGNVLNIPFVFDWQLVVYSEGVWFPWFTHELIFCWNLFLFLLHLYFRKGTRRRSVLGLDYYLSSYGLLGLQGKRWLLLSVLCCWLSLLFLL